VIVFSHVGICVSDLARATRFYCDGLGFSLAESHEVGTPFARLIGIEGELDLRSQFIEQGGVRLELLGFATPAATGSGELRPMPRCGLTHLSVNVDDIDAVAGRLVDLGGTVLPETRTTLGPGVEFLYCTDPDGTRIELMRLTG
jgi:glyoxylase I family protein